MKPKRSEARINAIIDLFNAGHSMQEVGDRFGETRSAMAGVIGRLREKGDRACQAQYAKIIRGLEASEAV